MQRKTDLPPSHQWLIQQCQRINYGRIEGLMVRQGKPVMDRPPRIIREIKFGGDNGPRPESHKTDFKLKTSVRDLMAQLEALGDGVIACLEIQRGLPFRMTLEEVCA